MIGVILTLVTAITASGLAAVILAGASGEPIRVPAHDRDASDQPSSPDTENEG